MRIQDICILLTVGFLSTTVYGNFAGSAAAVDIGIVDQAKKIGMPIIEQTLNDYKMDKITFDGGWVDNVDLQFQFNSLDAIKVSFDGSQNAVRVTADNINGTINGDFMYKLLLIQAKGHFKVTLFNDAVKLDMVVPLTSQSVDGRNMPTVDISKFDLDIDHFKFRIDITGSVLADISDAFVTMFKKLILKEINAAINDKVPALAKDTINSMIAKTNGRVSVYDKIMMDITFASNPVISDSGMALYLNSTVYEEGSGYKIPLVPISDIQVLPSTPQSVQVSLSHFAADSFLMALQEMNLFSYTINDKTLGSMSSMLTTTYLDGLLPGLQAKYGKDQPVTIEAKTSQAPRTLFKLDNFGILMTMDMIFRVNNEVAIVVSLQDFVSTVQVTLKETNMTVKVLTCKVSQVSASQSQIGEFSSDDFRAFFNVGSKIAIPFINNIFLNTPFVLPNTYLNMVRIQAAEFKSFDNYLAVSVTPEFIV
ncbi:bpi2 domain containing protein [Stylonychia lemnae]|uniref:Bpi2 domain containing protein n=1 Tax=Stylonychia lemnae TaxID=5949 RepID=A0A078B0K5_STYLE|nr:bpi2 domain containing protein [Stylonychia lemnae]|eukprot:CDW88064.1 bpi2 domain containing protein [Stylonychia lemnae]